MVELVRFPAVNNANEDGLLAMGGDLSVDTLVSAYSQGIFPWFNEGQPVLWWSPDPRMVLYPQDINRSRSLRKKLKQARYRLTINQAFEHVISACALRGDQNPAHSRVDTWITSAMRDAYTELHLRHYAHSVEVWQNDQLIGGLYGVALGRVFFGESMFSRVSDASKIALVWLCRWLQRSGFEVIDCQIASEHLFSMGALEVPRSDFMQHLTGIDINVPNHDFARGFEHFLQDNAIT